MTSVPVGITLTSGVNVAMEVFLGVVIVAAELHATTRNNNTASWTHTPFFILSSPSKLKRRHYNLNLTI